MSQISEGESYRKSRQKEVPKPSSVVPVYLIQWWNARPHGQGISSSDSNSSSKYESVLYWQQSENVSAMQVSCVCLHDLLKLMTIRTGVGRKGGSSLFPVTSFKADYMSFMA